MRKVLKIGYIVLFCIIFHQHNAAIASDKDETSSNQDIEFILKTKFALLETENVFVDYGKEVEVDIFIKNNTDREIQICKIPSSGVNLITRYFDNDQQTFQDKFTVSSVVPQKEDFISIAAKETKLLSTSMFGKEYFNKPGRWGIKIVQQHSSTGEKLGIKAWTGNIKSNELKLSVENNLILEGSVEVSRIGEPGDRIDAYVDGGIEQNFFVSFHVDKVIKGKYAQPTMGIRLHSPSRTFGLNQGKNEEKRFKLFFINEVLSDGRSIWLLQPESKPIK